MLRQVPPLCRLVPLHGLDDPDHTGNVHPVHGLESGEQVHELRGASPKGLFVERSGRGTLFGQVLQRGHAKVDPGLEPMSDLVRGDARLLVEALSLRVLEVQQQPEEQHDPDDPDRAEDEDVLPAEADRFGAVKPIDHPV